MLFVILFITNTFASCIFESPGLVSSSISSTDANTLCNQFTECTESFPLLSFIDENLIDDTLTCENTPAITNCTSGEIVSTSLSNLIEIPLYKSLANSTYWVNSYPDGTYSSCTTSNSSYQLGNLVQASNCDVEYPIICVCRRYLANHITMWSIGSEHYKLYNGSIYTCPDYGLVFTINDYELTSTPNNLLVTRDATLVLNVTASSTSLHANFTLVNSTSVRFNSQFTLSWMIYNQIVSYQIVAAGVDNGILLNGCNTRTYRLEEPTGSCATLSKPFAEICQYAGSYNLIENFLQFLGIGLLNPIDTPEPSSAPTTSPTTSIPSFHPTTRFPSSSPTKSPTKSRPTMSPTKKSSTSSPTVA